MEFNLNLRIAILLFTIKIILFNEDLTQRKFFLYFFLINVNRDYEYVETF